MIRRLIKTVIFFSIIVTVFCLFSPKGSAWVAGGPYNCPAGVNAIADGATQAIALECHVRAGLAAYFTEKEATMGTGEYPGALDAASNGTCNSTNPCLTEIYLKRPLADGRWTKISDTQYDRNTGESCVWDGAAGFNCTY